MLYIVDEKVWKKNSIEFLHDVLKKVLNIVFPKCVASRIPVQGISADFSTVDYLFGVNERKVSPISGILEAVNQRSTVR